MFFLSLLFRVVRAFRGDNFFSLLSLRSPVQVYFVQIN